MSFPLDKPVGAGLFALLLALGVDTLVDRVLPPSPQSEAAGAGAKAAVARPAPAAAPAGAKGGDALALIASASPEAGARVARKCVACHTFEKDGPHRVGPNLYGVIGGPVTHAAGYPYSDALKGKAGEAWSYENLDRFLTLPRAFAKGTKMTFGGLNDPADRAAVIRYMMEYTENPPPPPPG